MKFDAILPAGGELSPEFSSEVGTSKKALIELGGETVLERTIRALKESGRIGRTVVIGNQKVQNHPGTKAADFVIDEADTGPNNIFSGLEHLRQQGGVSDKVAIVTCDLPFISPQIVNEFIDTCPQNKDICVPMIGQDDFSKRFPGTEATFVTLRDGTWTTGCLYLIDVAALERARPHINRVFENRKSKVGMARLLGASFVWRMMTKTLTVPDIEQKIVSLLGCTGAAIPNSAPELAFDIDYQEDYEYALKYTNKEVMPVQ